MAAYQGEIPHAIVFLFDPENKSATTPLYAPGDLVASDGDCISIGTQSKADGETSIHLLRRDHDLPQTVFHIFGGNLITPSCTVDLRSCFDECLATIEVEGESVRVDIYVNDASSPSIVCIVCNDGARVQ